MALIPYVLISDVYSSVLVSYSESHASLDRCWKLADPLCTGMRRRRADPGTKRTSARYPTSHAAGPAMIIMIKPNRGSQGQLDVHSTDSGTPTLWNNSPEYHDNSPTCHALQSASLLCVRRVARRCSNTTGVRSIAAQVPRCIRSGIESAGKIWVD